LGTGENAPNRIRIREAYSIGADILAVACPVCAVMLGEALKAEELEDKLHVMDISEIVLLSCFED
jgi:Fe-S oxidoreductase